MSITNARQHLISTQPTVRRAAAFSLGIQAAALSLLVGISFCMCVGVPQTLSAQDPSKPFAIKQQVNLVALPVTVREREGRFISNLGISNFRVYEDGRPQEITLFRNEDMPVTVGLVVDHSASMAAKELEVALGAQAFVQASNPQDREFVINFNERVSFGLPENVAFTSNVDDLRTALSSVSASGETALYDAVAVALETIQKDNLNRKALLLISDGGDDASKRKFPEVLRMAQTLNVIIYSIGLFDQTSADQNPKILAKFADETGGYSYFPNSASEVLRVCQRIAEDIRHQYTLGYSPANLDRSGYRKIRVSVTAPGRGKLIARTRAGYYFPSPTTAEGSLGISETPTKHDGP